MRGALKLRHGPLPSSTPFHSNPFSSAQNPLRRWVLNPPAILISIALVLIVVTNLDTLLFTVLQQAHSSVEVVPISQPAEGSNSSRQQSGEQPQGLGDTAARSSGVKGSGEKESEGERRGGEKEREGSAESSVESEGTLPTVDEIPSPPSPPSPRPPPSPSPPSLPTIGTCPSYFSFVNDDLEPWRKRGGITWEAVNRTRLVANDIEDVVKTPSFFAVIIGGRLYYEDYHFCFGTRKEYTLFSILDLIERFPGQVPDVAFMFFCFDAPLVFVDRYLEQPDPPIVLQYCSSPRGYGINFPDWTYWGWEELRIPPWFVIQPRIAGNASRIPWEHRIPRAQWKGQSNVLQFVRGPVVACGYLNTPHAIDSQEGWMGDDEGRKLENHCKHKYRLYMEGYAWSVSMKYILACSPTPIFIEPFHWDFFSRALVENKHYVRVPYTTIGARPSPMCKLINDTVTELEADPEGAKRMAESVGNFISKEVTMDYVYDYMLYVFKQYASLQKFEPSKLENLNVTEVTVDALFAKLPFLKEQSRYTKWDPARKPCFEE